MHLIRTGHCKAAWNMPGSGREAAYALCTADTDRYLVHWYKRFHICQHICLKHISAVSILVLLICVS